MKKKILIFIIAYKAKHRLLNVYNKIPSQKLKKYDSKILISDDASKDETILYMNKIYGKKY